MHSVHPLCVRSLVYFLTSVPLRSLGVYTSSVICTVRPKSTRTALSDISTMLLAKKQNKTEAINMLCRAGYIESPIKYT